MVCQVCHINPAEVKLTQVINNKKIELSLCKKCAEEKGMGNPLAALPQIFGNFILSLLGEDVLKPREEKSGLKCQQCGLAWDDFKKTGLLGCDICYQSFHEELKVVLRRIHGSNQHIGSRPKSYRFFMTEAELENAKLELEQAIENENFERAAELRDMIRDAQREMEKN
jgi:protein arginine kinase activator